MIQAPNGRSYPAQTLQDAQQMKADFDARGARPEQ